MLELATAGTTPVRVLFLAANPKGTDPLRTDEEARAIEIAIRDGDYRDSLQLTPHGAVRVGDLQSLLLRYRPVIVHFAGHGSTRSEIIFENEAGAQQPVSGPILERLFGAFKDTVKCVVLNACYSVAQALAIAKHVDCVIGMTNAIGDAAAIQFATAFYRALAFGKTIEAAFELGCIEIGLHGLSEQDTPKLLRRGATAGQTVQEGTSPQGSSPRRDVVPAEGDAAKVPADTTPRDMAPAALEPAEGQGVAVPEPAPPKGRAHPVPVPAIARPARGPLRLLPAALHAFPAVRYALAALALAACVAIGLGYLRSPQFAIIGLVAGFAVMGLLVVFSHVAARREAYGRQAAIFVWVCLCLFIAWAAGMTLSVFSGWPLKVSMFETGRHLGPGPGSGTVAPGPAVAGRSYRRSYYQGFSGAPPPGATRYEDVWQIGESGDWTAAITDGAYHLCNSANDATASYTNRLQNIVDDAAVDMTDGRVTVRVATEPPNTTHSGAGLLFRCSRDTQRYLAFLLNPGPGVSLLQRRGNSLKVLWSDGISAPPGKLVELRVEGQGDKVALYVDDRLVHIATVGFDDGDVGVMAYSTGCFTFDDLILYAPVAEKHAP